MLYFNLNFSLFSGFWRVFWPDFKFQAGTNFGVSYIKIPFLGLAVGGILSTGLAHSIQQVGLIAFLEYVFNCLVPSRSIGPAVPTHLNEGKLRVIMLLLTSFASDPLLVCFAVIKVN